MTAAPRKGRKVSFAADTAAPQADPWSQISTLRFMIHPLYGGELLVDFTGLRPRGLALAFARSLFKLAAPRGPIMVRSSLKTYANQLPSFFAYLAGTGDRINGPADLRAHHIDGFETWLSAQGKSRVHGQTYVAKVVSVLRRIADDSPELVDCGLRERLRYVSSHAHVRSRPRDAYSPYVARQLRDAARADIAAIEARLRSGPQFDEVPQIDGAYCKAHAAIETYGVLGYRDPTFQSLYKLRKKRDLTSDRLNLSLHAAHYLTADDIVPLLVLLLIETGLELECCKSLTLDCLRNAAGGTVDIAYTKLRAHGAEHKTIRVRDRGSSTAGGLIRRIIALSSKARVHNSSDNLWVYFQPGEITAGIRQLRLKVSAWTQRHCITDDQGKPLHLCLSYLRKTHKALWYLKTEGHMARFAVGHTVDIAARHYADIPSLRPLHEQTVADALEEVLAGPMILPPQDEDRLRGELASPDPDDGGISTALLNGEQDVWLASCGNFYSSPFASAGTPCPTPFWACLDCRNAVITARKLPAILTFLSFVDAQRIGLSAADWTAKFGHAHDRIVQQILPAFAEDVVTRARAQVANDPPTVYLPPEARA